MRLRAGAYGHTEVSRTYGGDSLIRGGFVPEVGRTYEVTVEISREKIQVLVDGEDVGSATIEEAERGRSGFVGFYTQCTATFDDFEVTSGYAETKPTHAVGNLTYDGRFKYVYDAWTSGAAAVTIRCGWSPRWWPPAPRWNRPSARSRSDRPALLAGNG